MSFIKKNSIYKEKSATATKVKFRRFKVGRSPQKNCFICYNESPLKMMKIPFCFISEALFVLKIFEFST